jgi:hypothetical protein
MANFNSYFDITRGYQLGLMHLTCGYDLTGELSMVNTETSEFPILWDGHSTIHRILTAITRNPVHDVGMTITYCSYIYIYTMF